MDWIILVKQMLWIWMNECTSFYWVLSRLHFSLSKAFQCVLLKNCTLIFQLGKLRQTLFYRPPGICINQIVVRQADTEKTVIRKSFYIYRSLKTGDIACHTRLCVGKFRGQEWCYFLQTRRRWRTKCLKSRCPGGHRGPKAKAPAPPEVVLPRWHLYYWPGRQRPKDQNIAFPTKPSSCHAWTIRRQQLRTQGRVRDWNSCYPNYSLLHKNVFALNHFIH